MTSPNQLVDTVDGLVAEADALATIAGAPDRYAGYARDIAAAARHLAGILSSAPRQPETLDLRELAAEARTMAIAAAMAKGLRIAVDGGGARGRGDRRAVLQILANLLANAVKFTPPNGAVSLVVGSDAAIDVRDTGPGVAGDDRERIFEPFHQLGGAEGVGLGLSISRRLAREMGGDLTFVPSDAGACFRLTLPAA